MTQLQFLLKHARHTLEQAKVSINALVLENQLIQTPEIKRPLHHKHGYSHMIKEKN